MIVQDQLYVAVQIGFELTKRKSLLSHLKRMLKQDRNGSYQGIRSLHKIFCFNDLLLLLILFRTSFTSLFRSVLINFIQFYSNENHNSLSLDACLSKIGTIRIKGFDHDVKFFCFNHLLLLILFWTSFTSLFRLVLN